MKQIMIATNNDHKLREFQFLYPGCECVKNPEGVDIREPFDTFRDNARYKAKYLCEKYNVPVLADDSGLVVPSLNGEPGVYSARYAKKGDDEANIDKLLENLKGKDREAYFVTVICLYFPSGEFHFFEGRAYGEILEERRGRNGFGYDPIFYFPLLSSTFAEMSLDEKSEYSHRAEAIKKLKKAKLI